MQRDSMANTFAVTLVLCIVCSLLVSAAAVGLRGRQEENKLIDRQKNIIAAAGLSGDKPASSLSKDEIAEIFKKVERKLIDLETGQEVSDPALNNDAYDPKKAAKDAKNSAPLAGKFNLGSGISRREKYTWVYEIKDASGRLEQVVLPIYGKGLWSTLYGYIALNSDLKTVGGLTFYEHAETPGLGGEVDNENWKAQWKGKEIWDGPIDDGNLRIGVAKGSPTEQNADYQVDGLSGATITARGVQGMLRYWFSEAGFAPYLKEKLKVSSAQQGASDGSSQG